MTSKQFESLGLNFPAPTPVQDRFDFHENDRSLLLLLAVNNLSEVLDESGTAGTDVVPTYVPVTAASTILAAASDTGRVVRVHNTGGFDILLLAGGTPKWSGQDAATEDRGIAILEPGDWYETNKIKTVVNARCRTGEASTVTVETEA